MEVLKTSKKVKVECRDEVVLDANNSSAVSSASTEVKMEDTVSSSEGDKARIAAAADQRSVEAENKNNRNKKTPERSMVTTMLEDVCNVVKLPKKDGTGDSLAVKSDENESVIVLDDIPNDLDADLSEHAAAAGHTAKNQKMRKDVMAKSPAVSDDKKTKGKDTLNMAENREELNTGQKVKVQVERGDQVTNTNTTTTVSRASEEPMEIKVEDTTNINTSSKGISTAPTTGQMSEKQENKNNNNLNQRTSEPNVLTTTSKVGNKFKTAVKSEENESLIVLDDDIHNDLDADLATSEKKTKPTGGKKSNTSGITAVSGSAKSQKDQKTDKKVEWKKDSKDDKSRSPEDTSKAKKGKDKFAKVCNLWITGLNAKTKATDLKALFIKYGKVSIAKVVTTARIPGQRCYGFVTMSKVEEATKCITHLNQTKFNGTIITVKMAKNALGTQIQKKATETEKKTVANESKPHNSQEKCSKAVKKSPLKTDPEKKPAVKGKVPTSMKLKPENKAKPRITRDVKSSKDPWSTKVIEESERRRKEIPRTSSSSQHRHHLDSHRSLHHSYRPHQYSHRHAATDKPPQPTHSHDRRSDLRHRVSERRQLLLPNREISYDREPYKFEKARKELRYEERAERSVKRFFEGNHLHGETYWDHHNKQQSMDDTASRLSLRYDPTFSESSRYRDLKESYSRRGGPYHSRESKTIDSSEHFDVGRVSESYSCLHNRYNAAVDNSSRLDMHLNSDKFDRMDSDFRRDSDYIMYHESDRRNMMHSRDMDHRNVSAHNRLGRMRNSPDLDWKMSGWSDMSGNVASGGGGSQKSDRWMSSNTMRTNHDHYSGGAGSSSMYSPEGFLSRSSSEGGGGGGGSSSSGGGGLMLSIGPGNSFSYPHSHHLHHSHSHHTSMGGGGGRLEGQMRDSDYNSYTNMERGYIRRF